MSAPRRLLAGSALALAWVPLACGGDDREPPGRPTVDTAEEPVDYRHRGLDDTNETEVARLVEERLRPARRPRCRVTERLPGGNGSRFRCAAGTQRYAVTWEHYGSGRYIIAARGTDGSTQELARGVLTISE